MGIPDTRVSIERRTYRTLKLGKVSRPVLNLPNAEARYRGLQLTRDLDHLWLGSWLGSAWCAGSLAR